MIADYLILYGVGCMAGFMNVMAGGGSTISLPALIFLGLDGAVANGTNRVAIFIQNIAAVSSFHQDNSYDFRSILRMVLWTLPGAVIGALVAVRISNELFEIVLGVIIIGVILSLALPQKKLSLDRPPKHPKLIYPALLLLGFYGGFIQVGVGFLFMAAFSHILRMNLLRVNMHKVFIIFFYTMPALVVFAWTDNIYLPFGLALAAGNATGGWWAAKLSIRRGERVIRFVLYLAAIVMAFKLIFT